MEVKTFRKSTIVLKRIEQEKGYFYQDEVCIFYIQLSQELDDLCPKVIPY